MSNPTTAAEAMGAFTQEAILKVSDIGSQKVLLEVYQMAFGVAQAFLEPKSASAAHLAELTKAGITIDDAVGLAADGLSVLHDIDDRDTKVAAAHVAVAHVRDGERELDKHVVSIGYSLRAKLGPKHPDLKLYGMSPLATGGRHAVRAAQKAAATTAPSAPATPAK